MTRSVPFCWPETEAEEQLIHIAQQALDDHAVATAEDADFVSPSFPSYRVHQHI